MENRSYAKCGENVKLLENGKIKGTTNGKINGELKSTTHYPRRTYPQIRSRIVQALNEHSYGLSTSKVSDFSGINYKTTKKHLEFLYEMGQVQKHEIETENNPLCKESFYWLLRK